MPTVCSFVRRFFKEPIGDANAYAELDESGNTIKLHIRKATINDAGDYQCAVENKAGSTIQTTRIQVERKEFFSYSFAHFNFV